MHCLSVYLNISDEGVTNLLLIYLVRVNIFDKSVIDFTIQNYPAFKSHGLHEYGRKINVHL